MALQGDVATVSVRELFTMLARTRASGRLSLSRGMTARRFHLSQGRVVLASSSDEGSLLGRLLVERGLVAQAQLHAVLGRREAAGHAPRLGQVLTEAGLVSPAALADVLVEKIERLLHDSLAWSDGQFYFDEEMAPRRGGAVTAAVDLSRVLSGLPARGAGDALPVDDADVLEVRALPHSRKPTAKRPPGVRRKRVAATA